MTETKMMITTTKGSHTGTLREVCAWQISMQGCAATIEIGDETIDVDAIDFGGADDGDDPIDTAEIAVARAIREQVSSVRLVERKLGRDTQYLLVVPGTNYAVWGECPCLRDKAIQETVRRGWDLVVDEDGDLR